MKKCNFCGVEKPATREFFFADKKGRQGLTTRCKECYKKEFYKKNAERAKRHYVENREKKLEYIKKYNNERKEQYLAKQKKYRESADKDAVSRYNKQYRLKKKEIISEKRRKYYLRNREKFREYQQKNRDLLNKRMSRYFKENKEKFAFYRQRRRTRRLGLEDNFTEKMWEQCKSAFNGCCAYCGKHKKLSHDHFIPLAKGGEYTINNIVPACKSCNSSKKDDDFFEWYPKNRHYSKERERRILKYLNYKDDNIQQLSLA